MNTNPMTPPSAGGVAGVLDVLRRDLAHATRFRCSADGSAVAGVYLLGFCFDPDLDFDPQACIDIVWWEPLLPNRAGGRGKWCRNNAGEAIEVSPTHWQPLPAAPTQEPSHAD